MPQNAARPIRLPLRLPFATLVLAAGALLASLAAPPAAAQINPFKGNSQRLSDDDRDMLDATIARLNARAPLQPGDRETWKNPRTGSSGTIKLLRNYNFGTAPCHLVQYDFEVGDGGSQRSYQVDWCRMDNGWKIRN